MTNYAPGKAKNQKCFKEISMSYETNNEITMDAYIEEKLNTKLPKLFFISQPMAGKTDVEIAAERTISKNEDVAKKVSITTRRMIEQVNENLKAEINAREEEYDKLRAREGEEPEMF